MKNLHENIKDYFRQIHPLDRNKDVFMYDIEVGNDKRMQTVNADTHQFQRISPLGPLKSSEFNDFLYIIGRFLISK